MALGIGNLGQIVSDFTSAVSEVFGISSNNNGGAKGGQGLFKTEYGGSSTFTPNKWLGNTQGPKVRYGFTIMSATDVQTSSGTSVRKISDSTAYYLDIPPQAIKQKEVFATNITATRKGIIVESEGVVFKDIVIQGTTGVFPGTRGGANTPGSNLFTDPFKAPTAPAGVSPDTGKSRASNVKTISGYEEFMRLRQYFLRYAAEKVKSDGNLFLIFINEKDDQALIVEPLEFEMERNSKSPMTYQYKIVLKAIGNLNAVFDSTGPNTANNALGILTDIGNLSANISATLKQSQAVIGASNRLLSRFSQALDQTFVNPLRQLQLAIQGLSEGTSNVLALPEILLRNVTSENLQIAENINEIGRSITNISYSTSTDQETRLAQTAEFQKQQQIRDRMLTDNKVPIPRSFVEQVSSVAQSLSDDLSDFTNLGDPLYDQLKGRTPTQQSESSKVVSDDEFLLMGALQQVTSDLAMSIASNGMFAADADIAFEQSQALFKNPNIPIESQITITKPETVREVLIQQGDILERIAQREYGDAGRWLDLVVLNKLKPPYIDENGGDGIRRPGETLLIGNK